MTRWLTAGILAALLASACEKKETPSTDVGANQLGLSASATPPSQQGHEATHIQQQKPTSSAVGGNKTETIGGNKSLTVGGAK